MWYKQSPGVYVGFTLSYAIFTGILFALLSLTEKLPADWTLFHLAGVTIVLTIAGQLLKRYLS